MSTVEREPARPAEQRKADSLAKLAAEAADVWVATASPAARPTSCRCRSAGTTTVSCWPPSGAPAPS